MAGSGDWTVGLTGISICAAQSGSLGVALQQMPGACGLVEEILYACPAYGHYICKIIDCDGAQNGQSSMLALYHQQYCMARHKLHCVLRDNRLSI